MAANNKIVLGTGEVLLDLTADTATADDVAVGKTFHLASGERAIGRTLDNGGGIRRDYRGEVRMRVRSED